MKKTRNEYVEIHKNGTLSHVELRITSSQGKLFIIFIDVADRERVARHHWHAYQCGKYPLIKTSLSKGKSLHLCRLLLDLTPLDCRVVDYKDHNRLNLQRANLRAADYSSNSLNRRFRADNTSGRIGIYLWDQGKLGHPYMVWTGSGVKNGRKYGKSFSVKKYGFDEAKRLAIEYRKKFEERFEVLSSTEGCE